MKFTRLSFTISAIVVLLLGMVVTSSIGNQISETSPPSSDEVNSHSLSSENAFIWETIFQPNSLDPHVDYETTGNWISYNVYETLYTYDWNSASTSPSIPLLAASAPVLSGDGLTYTITLREGILFHDGTPFNASCVKWNIERAMKIFYPDGPIWILADFLRSGSAVGAAASRYGTESAEFELAFNNWVANSGAIEVLGTSVVRFTLSIPYAPFIAALTYTVGSMMSPSFAIAHASDPTWAFWSGYGVNFGEYQNYMTMHTCGTGPYTLVEWIPDDSIELNLNPDYWRTSTSAQAGSLETVYIKWNDDVDAIAHHLQSGITDGCYWPKENALDIWNPDTQTSTDSNVFVSTGGISYEMHNIGFNMGVIEIGTETNPNQVNSPFYWKDFRKAASNAFDYDAYIDAAYNGFAIKDHGPIPIGMFGHNDSAFNYEYNLTAAIEDWNIAMMDSNFINTLNELDCSITFYYINDDSMSEQLCLLLKDGLSSMLRSPSVNTSGLEASMVFNTQALEWSDYFAYIGDGRLPFYFLGWAPDFADPDNYLFPMIYYRGVYASMMRYNNTNVNQWFEAQRIETDIYERVRLLNLIQETVADDAPYLWLIQETEFRTWGSWVHGDGLTYNPMHDLYFYHIYKTASFLDETPPQINSPADITIPVGATGQYLNWTATDDYQDTYTVARDDIVIDNGTWLDSEIIVTLDGLPEGIYNYTLTVIDWSDNRGFDSVIVHVVPAGVQFYQMILQVISIGSASVIIVALILIIKSKRQE